METHGVSHMVLVGDAKFEIVHFSTMHQVLFAYEENMLFECQSGIYKILLVYIPCELLNMTQRNEGNKLGISYLHNLFFP